MRKIGVELNWKQEITCLSLTSSALSVTILSRAENFIAYNSQTFLSSQFQHERETFPSQL